MMQNRYNKNMRPYPLILSFFLLVAIGIAGVFHTADAQAPDALYFPETGHSIRGPFMKFFLSIEDPFLILGYPIDEEMTDQTTGRLIQYFQHARLDLTGGPNSEVQIANLGMHLHDSDAILAPDLTSSPTCRYFAVTGKSVCYAFRQFYEANRGETYFGLPISDLEVRNGIYVQYFEKARMEWRPELPPGQHVMLTNLGKIYYDKLGITPSPEAFHIIDPSVSLQVSAFVTNAFVPVGSTQTVYVIVMDNYLHPKPGAMVSLIVTNPKGIPEVYRAAPTNANGITAITFPVAASQPTEIVKIAVDVLCQGQSLQTTTWFRVWW